MFDSRCKRAQVLGAVVVEVICKQARIVSTNKDKDSIRELGCAKAASVQLPQVRYCARARRWHVSVNRKGWL